MDFNFNFKPPQKHHTSSLYDNDISPTFPANATSTTSIDPSTVTYASPVASKPTNSLLAEENPNSLPHTSEIDDDSTRIATLPTKVTTATATSRSYKRQKSLDSIHRNETTRRIENEVLRVCKWENPARSFVILTSLVGFIILTGRYSLIQLVSCLLTLTISVNLGYILLNQFSHAAISNEPPVNPYNQILSQQNKQYLNKEDVAHFNSVVVDIMETVAKALTGIILIEDLKTSLKWLGIFFVTWRVSTVVSSRSIVLFFIISSFIFPRLYISNKDIIDARVRQGHTVLSGKLTRTQELAKEKYASVTAATMNYVHNKKSKVNTSSVASSAKQRVHAVASAVGAPKKA